MIAVSRVAAFLDQDLDADQTLGQGRRPVATDHRSCNQRFLTVGRTSIS